MNEVRKYIFQIITKIENFNRGLENKGIKQKFYH